MGPECEVVVIGGGPAGSTVAGLLAQRGRDVVVVERDAFPRFQIGESLLPQSVGVLTELGLMDRLDERYLRKYGARFICALSGLENRYAFSEAFDARYPYAFEVTRADFDTLLLDRARELGARVRQPCKVTDVLFEGSRCSGVVADGEHIRAQITVDATGRGALLASREGRKSRLEGLDCAALYAHYRGRPLNEGEQTGDIVIVMGERGWAWIIPFRDEQASIGIVCDKAWLAKRSSDESAEAFFERSLAIHPPAHAYFEQFAREGPVHTAANFSYAVSSIAGDGWLCAGDAFGFIDPLFSSGAHMAIRGGSVAATAIDAALEAGDVSATSFDGYVAAVRSASELFLGAVRATYEGDFREMLFAQDQRKTLRQVITSLLSGDVFHDTPAPTWVRFVRERYPAVGRTVSSS